MSGSTSPENSRAYDELLAAGVKLTPRQLARRLDQMNEQDVIAELESLRANGDVRILENGFYEPTGGFMITESVAPVSTEPSDTTPPSNDGNKPGETDGIRSLSPHPGVYSTEHSNAIGTVAPPNRIHVDLDGDDITELHPIQFFTPEGCGFTLPIRTQGGMKWVTVVQWSNGTREVREFNTTMTSPNGKVLHFRNLSKAAFRPSCVPWSRESIKKWVNEKSHADSVSLFRDLCRQIEYFLEFRETDKAGTTATLALWIMATYCYRAFSAIPYLSFGGPKGSGKSRCLSVLSQLVFSPVTSSNTTAASLFRSLELSGGTLLQDEAERLKDRRSPDVKEVLSILLAGYQQGQYAIRCEGENHEPKQYNVYGPKALACIEGLPDTLASRTIPITMFRASKYSPKSRRKLMDPLIAWQKLRDQLCICALELGARLLEMPEAETGLANRDHEIWAPLLTLASILEARGFKGIVNMIRDHAEMTVEEQSDDLIPPDDELILLELARTYRCEPTCGDILAALKRSAGSQFEQWKERGLSGRLARYGLNTEKARSKKIFPACSTEAQLKKIQSNYGIDLGFDLEGLK